MRIITTTIILGLWMPVTAQSDVNVVPITVEPELWRPDTDIAPPPRPIPDNVDVTFPITDQGNTLPGPARTGFALRNLETGETTEYPGMPRLPHAPPGWQTPDMYDFGTEPWSDRDFGSMALANSPDAYPARVNCRLFITFTDTSGNPVTGQCSGTMIDPEVILTAAHCVYYGVRNGRTVNDFASSVTVQPATHQGTDFYGTCNATHTGAALGYTDAAEDNAWGDWDWDVGIVIVNRAAGHLTSWHGLAWDGSCSWVQDQTYHNFAYPGANCGGTDGAGNPLHNGIDMYYWSGDWDSCPSSTLLQMDTPGAGCLNAVWGGMSGSSAYYIDDDSRFAHAVCSNGPSPPTYARYTRLWEAIADWILDDIEPLARGETLDLQSLNFNQEGDKTINVDAYEWIPDLSVKSANPTNDSSSSQSWPISVRLSDNDNITTSDTELSSGSFTWEFDSISSVNINLNDVRVPINTPSGTYFIGAIIDDASTTSNNDSSGWDAIEVSVDAVPEMEPTSVVPQATEMVVGETFSTEVSVSNNGGASRLANVDVYASLNQTITTSDVLVDQFVTWVDAGGSSTYTNVFTVPEELFGQEWYLGVIVTNTSDPISSNDALASDSSVPVIQRPDNDDVCDATPISDGLHTFDTTWATTDGEDHAECLPNGVIENDIWFAYQAPMTGLLTITTCEELGGSADYDTDLAVYSGYDCSTLTLIDCNDDDGDHPCGGGPDYHSTVQIDVDAGVAYYIRVGGWSYLSAGEGELLVETKLHNDDCEDALPINVGDTWFSTNGATTDGDTHAGECQFGGYTGNDIWYVFTSPCTGMLTVSTCGQVDYDSDLVLYEGHECDSPDLITCNDDGPGCPGYSSKLEAPVEAGVEYLLRVGGYLEDDTGSGTITLACTPNESGGDVDGDGDTDIEDLLAAIAAWGSDDESADVNGDGVVNIEDLLQIIAAWTG